MKSTQVESFISLPGDFSDVQMFSATCSSLLSFYIHELSLISFELSTIEPCPTA
jgi:hypothetical protein